ncbi:MAG TPA: FkbM family methyltransferase [Dehalococcoidia bacterium]|nr:FkbM family methyltransferase [Dehalococcoidia bacterium]
MLRGLSPNRLIKKLSFYVSRFDYYKRNFGLRGVLLALAGSVPGGPKKIRLHPNSLGKDIQIRPGTSDIWNYQQIFDQDEYNLPFPEEPKVIVDAGAYVGFASIYFASRYPKARIIALEPDDDNYALLQENVRNYANVSPLKAALWGDSVALDVVDGGNKQWGLQTRPASMQPAKSRVAALTVDELMRNYSLDRIDILKIDIEGSEREVFAHPEAWIDGVQSMVVELHDRFAPGCKDTVYAAAQAFPRVMEIGENGEVSFFGR